MSKSVLYLVSLVFLGTGCEYQYTYRYVVHNNLNTSFDANLSTITGESSIIIQANETLEIFNFFGGIAGKDYYPADRRGIKWELDSLYVKTSNTTRSRNLADRCLWIFESKEREGIYRLTLTEDLLQ